MTPNQFTTLIAEQSLRPMDEPFKLMVYERIKVWRSRLIKNTLDRDPKDRKFFRQSIYLCMKPANDTPCKVPYCSCKLSVTIDKVPKLLRANGMLWDYIGGVDGMTLFRIELAANIPALLAGKYSGKLQIGEYIDDQIKVHRNPDLELIRIDGIFDNPEEVIQLNCKCNGDTDCDFWDQEFPVSNDIAQLIIQSILQIDFARPIVKPSEEIPVANEP